MRESWLGAGQPAGFLQDPSWRLHTDRGFSEIFQYLKAALIVVLLVRLYFTLRAKAYLIWSVAFLYLIFDDAYHVHESLGKLALDTLPLPRIFGVEGFVYAEMLAWAGLGLLLAFCLGYLYRKERETRRFTRRLTYLFALLFVFAGVIDGVHEAASALSVGLASTEVALVAVEDGGELIVLSVMVAYVLVHFLQVTGVEK